MTRTPDRLRLVRDDAHGARPWQLDAIDSRVIDPDADPCCHPHPYTDQVHVFATWAEAIDGIGEFVDSLDPDVAACLAEQIAARNPFSAHCGHCGCPVVPDQWGNWIDLTAGDGCTDSPTSAHEAARLVQPVLV